MNRNHRSSDEEETDEIKRPITARISKNTQLSLPAVGIIGMILSGFSIWLWFVHQRTDKIPSIEQKVDSIGDDVKIIKDILIHKALGP